MADVQLPRLMAIVKVDGKEISRKAIYASTVQDLEESVRNIYPGGPFWILERALVFDAGFKDYLDVDDHVPSDHDKFLLEFTMPSKTIGRSSERMCRADLHVLQNEHSSEVNQLEFEQESLPVEQPEVEADPTVYSGFPKLFSEKELRQKSSIFGKKSKELNRYQESINDAAFKLALENPTILENRGHLLKMARQALHDTGYKYAHGNKTRSKKFGQESPETTTNNPWTSNTSFIPETTAEGREIRQNSCVSGQQANQLNLDRADIHNDTFNLPFEDSVQLNATRKDLLMKARKTIHKKNKYEHRNKTKIKMYFREKSSKTSPNKPTCTGTHDKADIGFDEDILTVEEEEIRQRSCIFGRKGTKLNRYQININNQAFKLALKDPGILINRGELLVKARQALHDTGYTYAHGNKTRSKVMGEELVPKMVCLDMEREERLEEMEIDQRHEDEMVIKTQQDVDFS